eukprot:13489029-Ditylum_brightwellii.AAC.1
MLSSTSCIHNKDSSLAATVSLKSDEPSVTQETDEIYVWVTAKIQSSNNVFQKKELKEENATSILTTSLNKHASVLKVSEAIIMHNILTPQKRDLNKKS